MEEEYEERYTNPVSEYISRGCSCAPSLDDTSRERQQHSCAKLNTYDWLADIVMPNGEKPFNCLEVRLKNSHKEYCRIADDSEFEIGEIVAIEGLPGHDIGVVSLKGDSVFIQMRKKGINPWDESLKKVFRKAKQTDVEKWIQVIQLEEKTKCRARELAMKFGLEMKINDVEYQGDGTKATFYYTADDRVDFRLLIKAYAEEFRVRIEMRQIGARQEASRLGGIGSCGRELCCGTWLTSFKSVGTQMARTQQLSLNPQKLAGQCGKLKCCLSYEYDVYVDALKDFPSESTVLRTHKGDAVCQKIDVFKQVMWFSYEDDQNHFFELDVDKVREILTLNKKGTKIPKLDDFAVKKEKKNEYDMTSGPADMSKLND